MASRKHSVDEQLPLVIEELLMSNEDITARSVAKRIGVAPSTITRNEDRAQAVTKGAENQSTFRALVEKAGKQSREELIRELAERERQLTECKRQVQILIASHKAMILAVGEVGGIAGWARFFSKYQDIRDELRNLGAATGSNVVTLAASSELGNAHGRPE